MKDPGRVLVVGAGPTGLGAAWRLHELGCDDFLVLEAGETPGGLASSFRDEHGFTWDVGGHVQFSHYAYYDSVLDRAVR
jgi:protoporphyrinogen oxidase